MSTTRDKNLKKHLEYLITNGIIIKRGNYKSNPQTYTLNPPGVNTFTSFSGTSLTVGTTSSSPDLPQPLIIYTNDSNEDIYYKVDNKLEELENYYLELKRFTKTTYTSEMLDIFKKLNIK